MIKKRLVLSLIFLTILSLTFVSASWFSDVFGQSTGKITSSGVCGNGIIERGEQCDGEEALGSIDSCEDFGFQSGSLVCNSNCAFDTSDCVARQTAICGDGIVQTESGEQCDAGSQNGVLCNLPVVGYCTYCTNDCQVDKYTGGTTTSEEFCKDSDGGNNIYVKGTLTDKNDYQTKGSILTHEDFCLTKSTGDYITEFYCSGVYQDSSFISCPNGCSDGACVQSAGNLFCNDSDGKNIYVKGITTGNFNPESIRTEVDSCQQYDGVFEGSYQYHDVSSCTGDVCFVKESWADGGGNGCNLDFLNCPNGCSDGACVQTEGTPTCTDDPYYGPKGDGPHYSDYCTNDKTDWAPSDSGTNLVKLTCSDGNRGASLYTCPKGCVNGEGDSCYAGVPAETCTDSDGGVNLDVKGTTTSGIAGTPDPVTDFCDTLNANNPNGLTEGYCGNDGLRGQASFICPNGCVDGACVQQEKTPAVVCTDSDNGKDYYEKGVGTGDYVGSTIPVIFGLEPDPTIPQPTTDGYTTYSDHCFGELAPNQLDEAYCDGNGYLAAEGYYCPNGCSEGVCLRPIPAPVSVVIDFFKDLFGVEVVPTPVNENNLDDSTGAEIVSTFSNSNRGDPTKGLSCSMGGYFNSKGEFEERRTCIEDKDNDRNPDSGGVICTQKCARGSCGSTVCKAAAQ